MGELNRLLSLTLENHGDRPALRISSETISYRDLDNDARQIFCLLKGQRIGILAGASLETYAGIWAVARSDRTYIPLNADFPNDRLVSILSQTAPDTIIVDRRHIDRAIGLSAHISKPTRFLIAEKEIDAPHAADQRHEFLAIRNAAGEDFPRDGINDADATPLYIMSTSGSTGEPKKIAIPRSNVVDYLKAIDGIFDFQPEDRFSHFFRLSFDLSVHDIFVTWAVGGCLHVPGARGLLDPVAFARRHRLTVWFSVPSLLNLAMMARKLVPETLPDLRHALFCGEALSFESAEAFQASAPMATVTNLYGPTEATIAITQYRLPQANQVERQRPAFVPIGKPFPGQEAIIVEPDLSVVPACGRGELLLGGSQLAPGYLDNAAQTEEAFVDRVYPGFENKRWYRTGDIVMASDNGLVFLGRSDSQVKLRGHRIELGEIEAILRQLAETPLAVVIAYPPFGPGPADKLLAFLMPPHKATQDVRKAMRAHLPAHMRPARIVTLDRPMESFLNANQKVDRSKIAKLYQGCSG